MPNLFEPTTGIEPVTSSLPRKRSTPELHRLKKERCSHQRRDTVQLLKTIM